MDKFTWISDNHGNHQDDRTVEAFLEFQQDFKPTIRIHGGDCYDLACLRKGASQEEKAEKLDKDMAAGDAVLKSYFKDTYSRNIFLWGNHDDRLYQLQSSAKVDGLHHEISTRLIKDVEGLLKNLNCESIHYDAAQGVKIGKLSFFHGFHHNEHAAKKHAEIYSDCIFGHIHTDLIQSVRKMDIGTGDRAAHGHSAPCACSTDPSYMKRFTSKLRWTQGWLYGFIDNDGSYEVYCAKKNSKGKFNAVRTFFEY